MNQTYNHFRHLKASSSVVRIRCARPFLFAMMAVGAMLTAPFAQAAGSPTATTFHLSSSSVTSGTVVTFIAAVSNGLSVTGGMVTFCDATAVFCEDSALIGTAQLTAAGTAMLRLVPGVGNHSYIAVFNGTAANAGSASYPAQTLAVKATGSAPYPTTASISASGAAGNFTLNGTVFWSPNLGLAPSRNISFLDTTDGNLVLASVALNPASLGQSFSTAVPYPTAGSPQSVAIGDFNGDGFPDLVVVNYTGNLGNSVSILMGNANGSFQPQVRYPVGSYPRSVVVGDFDGDGFPDIAVTNSLSSTISLLLNKGDSTGSFKTQVTYPVGGHPQSLTLGDFNGDGVVDLAVANTQDATISVLMGNSDGTFQSQATYPVGSGGMKVSNACSVTAGDFNGDGSPDLAVANQADGTVSVLLNKADGTGSFQSQATYTVGNSPEWVAVGDFNGDGNPDLAIVNGSDKTVGILLANADGTFQPQVAYATGNNPQFVATGDFNGNGKTDLVVLNQSDNTASVLLDTGNGSGSFQPQTVYSTGNSPFSVAVGDFNGDGKADLAVVNHDGTTVSVLLNVISESTGPIGVTIADASSHQIDASYTGDSSFTGSVSGTILLSGSPVVTSLALSAKPDSSTYGQPVTLTATLTPSVVDGLTTDGESAEFMNGTTQLGTGILNSGTATLTLSMMPASTGPLTAVYSGKTNFQSTTSPALSFRVSKATASVTPTTASKTYGAADPAFTGTLAGFLPADNITATYSRIAGESVAEGPHVISGLLSPTTALANYNVTYNTANFTIGKATASFTPIAASKTYGTADPAFTGTLTGFAPADNVTATYRRAAGETVEGGSYAISGTLRSASESSGPSVTQMTFSYTLPNDSSRSAGVYDSTGTLIRTLWSGKLEKAGSYTVIWDGLAEGGSSPSNPPYTIKLLDSTVSYVYDGVIGNTSTSWTGPTRWDIFGSGPTQIRFAFVGGKGYMTTGYAEGTLGLGYINAGDPNTPHALSYNYSDVSVIWDAICTDGTKVYIANAGGPYTLTGNLASYVTVLDGIDGYPSNFTSGMAYVGNGLSTTAGAAAYAGTTFSTIDQGISGTSYPTGIAVQKSGNLLAVAHGNWGKGPTNSNIIHLFDKNSGASAGGDITTVTNPQTIAFSAAGLWVISNSSLVLVSNVGESNTLSSPITGLSNPVYVAVNKATDHVFVLDGGSSQQMKEYDTGFNLVRTYGDLGGYTDLNPTITYTRLMLDHKADLNTTATNYSLLAVQDNNDVWIGDGGNLSRILHISAANIYVNQILFFNPGYQMALSHSQSSRVFLRNMEFAVNYAVPILPGDPSATGGNGSWALVKNWNVGLYNISSTTGTTAVLYAVEQLSDGRVYADLLGASNNHYEVELPVSGTAPMRLTGNSWNAKFMAADGSIRYLVGLPRNAYPNYTSLQLSTQSVTGFDASGNPIRGAAVLGNVVSMNPALEPTLGAGGWGWHQDYNKSAAGILPIFRTYPVNTASPCVTTNAPHLAGMSQSLSHYAFKVMAERAIVYPDWKGGYPCSPGYGGHGGTTAIAEGHHIIAFYDGQYAANGEFFTDWYDDGLFVGQYGKLSAVPTGNRSTVLAMNQPAASGGNITMALPVTVNGLIYTYNPLESGAAAPIQRWHFDPSLIHEYAGTGTLGSAVRLTLLLPVVAGDHPTGTYSRAAGESGAGGPYAVSPLLDSSTTLANYNVTYNSANLTIKKAALTATANNAGMLYNTALPSLTGTLAGVVSGDGITASFTTAATSNSPVGGYPITPVLNDPANKLGNYTVSLTNGTLMVGKSTTTTTVQTSALAVLTQNSVAFTATVSSSAGIPAGSVSFMDGGTALGSATLDNTGVAILTLAALGIGSHPITAVYFGNIDYLDSTSSAIIETVVDFGFTVNGTTTTVLGATVASGNPAVFALQLTPTGGSTFAFAVTVTLAGLPAGATYAIAPSTIQAGSGTTAITVAVNTAKTSASSSSSLGGLGFPKSFMLALALPLFGMRKLRRVLHSQKPCMPIILAVLMLAGITACGDISKSPTPNQTYPPSQTYPMTLTATSGAVHRSVTVNLTIQ